MLTLAAILSTPFVSRAGHKRSALLDSPPPPIDTTSEWKFGPYSWKVVVEARDDTGDVYRTFVGYSKNMNITERTASACDRYKKSGTTCGDPIVAMKGGDCDETIFMKEKNSDHIIRLLL